MINENHLVVQGNSLINSHYQLTETEQKLMRVIISMLMPSTLRLKDQFYRIEVNAFAHLLGHKDKGKNLFKSMERTLNRLNTTPLTVITLTGDTIKTTWISAFRYEKSRGYIDIEISNMLETELLQLRRKFTQYHLWNISKLKGGHTIRIYELIRQHNSAHTHNREMQIDELRKMLGLEPSEYKNINDFIQHIITPAHSEICKKSDLTFDYRPIKESRKIVAVEFYNIQQKEDIPPAIMELIPEKHRKNKKTSQIIRQYIKSHGPEYVTEKLQYISTRPVKDYEVYLYKALSENYETKPTPELELPEFTPDTVFEYKGKRGTFNGENIILDENQILAPLEMAQGLQDGTLTRASQTKLEKELQKEFEVYRHQKIDEFIAKLPQKERKAIEEHFIQKEINGLIKPIFQRGGMENPIIDALFKDFIGNMCLEELTFENHSQGKNMSIINLL